MACAGLVAWMGVQILMNSLAQLSDTSDPRDTERIRRAAQSVDGVISATGVRCRWMSSSVAMADLSILIGPKVTASAAQRLVTLVRDKVMDEVPEVAEVLVRSQTMCPLLSEGIHSPSAREVEAAVENVVGGIAGVDGVPAVQVRRARREMKPRGAPETCA